MRLLFVAPIGYKEVFRSYSEYLLARQLVKCGHEVIAYTSFREGDVQEERIDGIFVRRIPGFRDFYNLPLSLKHGKHWWNLYKLINQDKPDIIHLFHLRGPYYQITNIAKLLKIPVILTEAGILHDEYIVSDRERPLTSSHTYNNVIYRLRDCFRFKSGWADRIANYHNHFTLFNADRVVFESFHNREYALKIGLPLEKLMFIPEMIELDIQNEEDEDIKLIVDKLTKPIVLFIGQITYRKGFDILIKAMPKVIERYPSTTFVFISHNWRKNFEVLIQSVKQQGLESNFHFLGTVSEKAKWTLLRMTNVLCLPSRYEGFGLPLVEAMLAGCPIITTDVVAMNEIVQNEYNGLLFPLEDPQGLAECINRLLGDNELCAKLRENGYISVQQYDAKIHTSKYEKLYYSYLKSKK